MPGAPSARHAESDAHPTCGQRWRVIEASRLGVNEFLKKPVPARRCSIACRILTHPRAMVRLGDYYGPEPRKLFFEPMQKMVAATVSAAPPAPAEYLRDRQRS